MPTFELLELKQPVLVEMIWFWPAILNTLFPLKVGSCYGPPPVLLSWFPGARPLLAMLWKAPKAVSLFPLRYCFWFLLSEVIDWNPLAF